MAGSMQTLVQSDDRVLTAAAPLTTIKVVSEQTPFVAGFSVCKVETTKKLMTMSMVGLRVWVILRPMYFFRLIQKYNYKLIAMCWNIS